MPIKNYTTKVPANQSIDEIRDCLLKHGALGFAMEYEKGTGRISSLRFMLEINDQKISFSLPVNWRLFQTVLKSQKVKRWQEEDYCYRVAWRDIRDWVLIQAAMAETQMVSIPQLFLPYGIDKHGETIFEKVARDAKLFLN